MAGATFVLMLPSLDLDSLIRKYDVPTPRYTSYPTVPHWDVSSFTVDQWIGAVKKAYAESSVKRGVSMYIHLPFCENLCTYCACNTRITKNHGVESNYIRAVQKEWSLYKTILPYRPVLKELHLGGGTPTFFNPQNLDLLISSILSDVDIHSKHEFGFEGHPNNTSREHLRVLYDQGFRRVSFGVQDLDLKVQRTINRVQPFENLERVTVLSRQIGYTSVNYDLIYGLPFQTVETIQRTIEQVLTLMPDRIAFYSYAHVPWMRPGQRGYEKADLPADVEKRRLYETGRSLLLAKGYQDVGMDHFALPHDGLFRAQREGMLHRNFMGYTATETELLLGLGASAIGDAKYAYAQNIKKVEDYQKAVFSNTLPIVKGHLQTLDDLAVRRAILEIACQGKITQATLLQVADDDINGALLQFEMEGLIERNFDGYNLTSSGRLFIRNICGAFDRRLRKSTFTDSPVFSRAI